MPAAELLLAIGTNLGDRESNIREAVARLDAELGMHCEAMSDIIETEALGFNGPAFLNCIVRYRSCRRPLTILAICKKIEREMGRTGAPEYDSEGRRIYHDRIIDIDILTYGKRCIRTADLTIPHPQVETRPFIKELLLTL